MFNSLCSQKTIKSEEDVKKFIENLHKIISSSYRNLTIIRRTLSEDKTYNFMVEYGITSDMICEQLLQLDITNYSYTDKERDKTRQPENVWIFGQILQVDDSKVIIEVYIKLKLRNNVICLSFHPKEDEIQYPYL